jgi:hypothetical protein
MGGAKAVDMVITFIHHEDDTWKFSSNHVLGVEPIQ